MYVCMGVCVYVCVYVCVWVCMYVYVYVYVCERIRMFSEWQTGSKQRAFVLLTEDAYVGRRLVIGSFRASPARNRGLIGPKPTKTPPFGPCSRL